MPILPTFCKNSTKSLLRLQSYWTNLHHIFTPSCIGICAACNACIYKTILHFISERQRKERKWSILMQQIRTQNKLVTIAPSLWLPRNLCQFYNPHTCVYQMLKCRWSSVQYLLRYLVRYVDFYWLVQKFTDIPCVISGASGLIAVKLAQNVAKIYRLTPVNRNWDIRIRFKMPACWTKVILQIWPQIDCHVNVPWGIGKKGRDQYISCSYLSFGEKIVKISPEIIWCNLKKKKLRKVKYIARSASLPSRLNTRNSAIAEGPREALVSRNPATTKHLTWKHYRVALFAWFYV